MGNSKNIIIVILIVALVALGGWTYYTLTRTAPQKAEAACKATIDSQVLPQAQAQCQALISQCQQVLTQLQQVPACAAAMSAAAGQ